MDLSWISLETSSSASWSEFELLRLEIEYEVPSRCDPVGAGDLVLVYLLIVEGKGPLRGEEVLQPDRL